METFFKKSSFLAGEAFLSLQIKVEPLNYYFSIIHRNKGTFRNQWQSLYNSLLIAIVIAYCKNRTWVFFFLFFVFSPYIGLVPEVISGKKLNIGFKSLGIHLWCVLEAGSFHVLCPGRKPARTDGKILSLQNEVNEKNKLTRPQNTQILFSSILLRILQSLLNKSRML